jgi:hypothetical protein
MTCDSQGGGKGRESGRVGKVRNDQGHNVSGNCPPYAEQCMHIYQRPAAVYRGNVTPRKAREEVEIGMITDFRPFLRDTASDFPFLFRRTQVRALRSA